MTRPAKAAVLGAGAFGTALSQLLARNGVKVTAWTRSKDCSDMINTIHENTPYLPGIPLSPLITATQDVTKALKDAELVIITIPTPYLRDFVARHRDSLPREVPIVICTKGLEISTLQTPYEIMIEETPGKHHRFLACLSGPSFAKEVALGKPTSVTVAAKDLEIAQQVQMAVSDRAFRAYTSDDVMGVEIYGAVKNVLAIAAGASDGFDFGMNARAAIVTRGLAEISRLAIKRGASPLSMGGLCGVGDLVLTCTGSLSRNWTVGNRMAKGETLDEVTGSMRQVAEGIKTAASVYQVSKLLGVDMPICCEVYAVLYENKPIADALVSLQGRPLSEDFHLEIALAAGEGGKPSV